MVIWNQANLKKVTKISKESVASRPEYTLAIILITTSELFRSPQDRIEGIHGVLLDGKLGCKSAPFYRDTEFEKECPIQERNEFAIALTLNGNSLERIKRAEPLIFSIRSRSSFSKSSPAVVSRKEKQPTIKGVYERQTDSVNRSPPVNSSIPSRSQSNPNPGVLGISIIPSSSSSMGLASNLSI